MINKEDKIRILNNMISNIDVHISALESDNGLDIEGKTPRQSILNDMYNKRAVLEQELIVIQDS